MTRAAGSIEAVGPADLAAVFAVDPAGLGGVWLRGAPGPWRDEWLRGLQRLLPATASVRRVPIHVGDDRLLGGLDLAATLSTGRPVMQDGLLAQADGGVLVLAMAERLSPSTAARFASVLDSGELRLARDGLDRTRATRIGLVALDEGLDAEEGLPERLAERLALQLTEAQCLAFGPTGRDAGASKYTGVQVAQARERLAGVQVEAGFMQALCAAAMALGIRSMRAPWLALRVACVLAALEGRSGLQEDDVARAASLVLGHRARGLPPPAEVEPEPNVPPDDVPQDDAQQAQAMQDEHEATIEDANRSPAPDPTAQAAQHPQDSQHDAPPSAQDPTQAGVDERVLEATLAAIPPHLLDRLREATTASRGHRAASQGRAGATFQGAARGHPAGVRRGRDLRGGARLDLIATLRAAAPWQALRRRERTQADRLSSTNDRVLVQPQDFHVARFTQHRQTTTLFIVDASGSAALHRLAEAKGAVEMLLADCYVRRDSVSVIAFRGRGAEVLLPPTRSLARARRSLAGLPGGGGTPLAAGLDTALALADAVRRRGQTPLAVLLTDGRANVARNGAPGRQAAALDALQSARWLRAAGVASLVLDTSAQPQEPARSLAAAMGADYLPLPHADAALLSRAVRAAGESARA